MATHCAMTIRTQMMRLAPEGRHLTRSLMCKPSSTFAFDQLGVNTQNYSSMSARTCCGGHIHQRENRKFQMSQLNVGQGLNQGQRPATLASSALSSRHLHTSPALRIDLNLKHFIDTCYQYYDDNKS